MPTVPRLTNAQVAPTALQAPRQQFVPDESLEIIGAATQKLAQVGVKVYEYDRSLKLQKLTNDTVNELNDFELSLQTDQDFDTQPERYRQKLGEVLQRVDSSVKDNRLKGLFKAELASTAARQEFNIRKNALKGKIGEQRAILDQTLLDQATQAGTGDPVVDGLVETKGMQSLDNAYAAGVISAEELQKKAATFRSDLTAAGVRRQILDDPEGAERALLEGGYEGLSGEDRTIWIERASARVDSMRREKLAAEDREYRLGERAQKDIQDATSKDGDKLLASGQLSTQWIEGNRDRLSPEDFRYFYGKLTGGGEGHTDSIVYSDLRQRAGTGQDVREQAREALTRGAIKTGDYDRIISEVEQQRPGWYKRGVDYIGTSAGVSDLNPDPAAAQRKAQMLDDWTDWAGRNKGATDDQAQKAYREIVKEYAIIDRDKMTLLLRTPSFMVGQRNAPDLDATEAATVQAFEAGEIGREEFERQAQLLQRWRDTMTAVGP